MEIASGVDWDGHSLSTLGPDGIVGTSDDSRHQGTQDWYRKATDGKIDGPAAGPYYNNESYVTPNPRHPSATAYSASQLNSYDFRLRVLPTGGNTYTYEMWFRMHNSAAEVEGAYWAYNTALNNTAKHGTDAWRKFAQGPTDVFPITDIDLSSVYVFMGLGNFADPASHSLAWGQIQVTGTYAAPAEVWVDDGYTSSGPNDGHWWGYDAFATIQDGVNAVATGGTVNVAAGTYTEQINVIKAVIIKGNNAGVAGCGTTRNTESIVNGGFYLTAAATIDGFHIQNGYHFGSFYDGLAVNTDDVTLQNNIIELCDDAAQGNGIEMVSGSDNLDIVANDIRNNWRGIYLNPATGITITANCIHDNNGCGVGIGSDGQNNLTVTHNFFYNQTVEGWGASAVGANVVAHNNSFIQSGTAKMVAHYGGSAIDASCNWWGSASPDFTSLITGLVNADPWLVDGTDNSAEIGFQPLYDACSGTNNPVTYAAKEVKPTGSISLPVMVDNFNNVAAISLYMNFDPAILTFTGFTPHGSLPSLTATNPSSGLIIIGWNNGAAGVTIPGSKVEIVMLHFTFAGGTSLLAWDDTDDWPCEYAYPVSSWETAVYPDDPASTYYIPGWVTNLGVTFTRTYTPAPGTITAVPQGGTSPFTYSWTGPGGFTAGNTATITPTNEYGDYVVTVTDALGATTTGTYYYGPVHNIDTYIDYALLNDAIDAAATLDGHTITMDPGTYVEIGQIVVDKNLTIIGDSKTTTIIKPNADYTSSTDGWIKVVGGKTLDLSNVQLDGTGYNIFNAMYFLGDGNVDNCTITDIQYQPSGPAYRGTGILVENGCDVDITGCDFTYIGRDGIRHRGTGAVQNNTYTGKGAGDWMDYFILAEYGCNILIEGNTVTNCVGVATVDGSGSAAIAVWDEENTTAVITNNILTGNSTGIGIAGINSATLPWPWPVVTIGNGNVITGGEFGITMDVYSGYTCNPPVTFGTTTITGQTVAAISIGDAVSPGTNYDISSITLSTTDNCSREDLVIHAIDAGNRALLVWNPNNVYVTVNSFVAPETVPSIQRGIDAVGATGWTVNVCPGTYGITTQILVNKSVDIVGDVTSRPVVQALNDLNGGTAGSYIFRVDNAVNANVDISNLVLDGNGYNVYGGMKYNSNHTGVVNNCRFQNIVAPGYSGFGIVDYGTMTITNNVFTNIGRVGMWIGGPGNNVSYNTYTGKGAIDCLDYGIEVGFGGDADITFNTITNCKGTASDFSTSAGIMATTYFGPGTAAIIENNVITGNTEGIVVGYDETDGSTVTVHNNDISGNTNYGIISTAPTVNATCNWWGTADGDLVLDETSGNVTYWPWLVSGTNEVLAGPGFYQASPICTGTPVVASAVPTPVYCGPTPGSILVIWTGGTPNYTVSWTGTSSGSAPGLASSPYTIAGLTAGSFTVTVTDANGSSSTVDPVVVQYLPVHNVTQNTYYATIQAAIDALSTVDGDVIQVCAGTYNEALNINKALTVQGAGLSTTTIDATGKLASAVTITATGSVKLDGFKIFNATTSDGNHFEITLSGGSLGSTIEISNNNIIGAGDADNDDYGFYSGLCSSNLIFRNNTISNCASHSLFLERLLGTSDIKDNTINSRSDAGPAIGLMTYKTSGDPVSNYEITAKQWIHNNTIDANGSSGILLMAPYGSSYDQYPGGKYTNIEISGNIISNVGGNGKGIQLESDGDGGSIENAIITQNSISAQIPGSGTSRGIRMLGNVINTNITENTLNGFYRGVYQSYSYGQPGIPGPSNNLVNNNSITGCTYAVENQYTDILNATCNWYGTADGDLIAPMIAGPVDYDSWLSDGTDNDGATPGFQSVPGSCNGTSIVIVSAIPDDIICGETMGSITVTFTGGVVPIGITWTGPSSGSAFNITSPYTIPSLAVGPYTITLTDANGSSASAGPLNIQYLPVKNTTDNLFFATIQGAIDAATTGNGDVIDVCAGTYNETVLVNKELTIQGPNAAISPNTGTRVAEAVIIPPAGDAAVKIAANNITMNGLKITGVSGSAPGCIVGGNNFSGLPSKTNNVNILKMLIETNAAAGIYTNGSELSTNWTISDNRIKDLTGSISSGINPWKQSNLTVTDNEILNTGYAGIQIVDVTTALVSRNKVTNVPQQGIQVGINTGNTTSDITISFNTVDNANTSHASDKGAIRLYGSTSIFGYVNITNNFMNNSYNGVAVKDGEAIPAGVYHVNNNYITGNTNYAIYHGGTGTLDAACNWYGVICHPDLIPEIYYPGGTVTYSPWLVNGTDNSGDPGFQPVPGSCAEPLTIISAVPTNYYCGSTTGSITVTYTGGTGPYSISWEGPTPGSASGITNPYTIASLSAGNYSITVTDANLCSYVVASVILQYLPVTNVTPNPDTYWPTIQSAIDAATAGDEIHVCAGTYYENLSVTKGISLIGAGRNITFVKPATADYTLKIKGNAGMTGNVLVEGFTFEDTDHMHWCIVETDHIPSASTLTFQNNRITDCTEYAWWDYHSHGALLCQNNIFDHVWAGIQLEGWDTSPVTIQNNEFTALHYADGDPNYIPFAINPFTYGGLNCTNAYTISGNYIHDFSDGGAGIVFNGGYSGKTPANYTNVTINANTIANVGLEGIRLRNRPSSGIDSEDPLGGVYDASIVNNFISGCGIDVNIRGSNPGTQVHNNSLTAFTSYAISNNSTTSSVDGTCNWYGTADGDLIATYISGSVTYSPWLTGDTDGGDPGFVPTDPCNGSPIAITETHVNVTCNGGIDGSIDITVSGGVSPLTYLWSPGGQTTEDLTGLTAGTYTVTVTDANTSTGTITVTITEPAVISISGVLTYHNTANTPMNNVSLQLKQGASVIYSSTTLANGSYTITPVCPGTYDVVLTTVKPVGGINSTDAGQVNGWFAAGPSGTYPSIERVRYHAGDVDNDTWLVTTDAGLIQSYYINNYSPPFNPLWEFWKQGESVTSQPQAVTLPQIVVPVSSPPIIQNFYGMVSGDFNRSFVPGTAKSASSTLTLIDGQIVQAVPGMTIDLPVRIQSSTQVGAISLILDFPGDYLTVESVYLQDNPALLVQYNVTGNELRIGWNSVTPLSLDALDAMISVRVKITDLLTAGDILRFKLSEDPLNELADETFEVIQDAVIIMDMIGYSAVGIGNPVNDNSLSLAAYPNPFNGMTNILYSVPVDGKITLEITGLAGNRITMLENQRQVTGSHQMSFNGDILPPGVYLLTLRLTSQNGIFMKTIRIVSQ
ncbi:MAG TPA: right-handed parallel beta-helix repeat-containing protein [Bacteroidales bacterium]|nr:right-handed parallel beta-helix repeat-containing protein [Bacteroidales bacterium]